MEVTVQVLLYGWKQIVDITFTSCRDATLYSIVEELHLDSAPILCCRVHGEQYGLETPLSALIDFEENYVCVEIDVLDFF